MKRNVSPEKRFNKYFSKKEVSFCEKSSILFYAEEAAVDSLNGSAIHTIDNNNFPLSSEFSNMLQSSSIDSHAEYALDHHLGNLPKAMVVLEKLPDVLIHQHTYLNSVTECYPMPNVHQNTEKVCSLKSDFSHHKKVIEPAMNKFNPALKENEYTLRNLNVLIPKLPFIENASKTCFAVDAYSEKSSDKASKLTKIANNVKIKPRKSPRNVSAQHSDQILDFIQPLSLQNSFSKLPSSKKTNTSKVLDKNNTEGKENVKLVDLGMSACTVSQVNSSEVSFDKYPCIHLEKLNLESHLYGISSSSDCLQSKKDVPMDLELDIINAMEACSLSVTEKTLPLNKEVSLKGVNLPPLEIDIEKNSTSSNAIFSDEIYPSRSILKNLLTDNLASSDNTILFDHGNSSKDISFLQNENIKNTNCDNSIPYIDAQHKFPVVVLERLNLPLSKSDTDYNMSSTESICTNLVPTVTNMIDLPIRIENVCSISREHFNRAQKCKKRSSKNNFNTIQKHDKNSSNQSFIDPFKKSELSIIKPKSKNANSFTISESSSEITISDNSISSSDNLSSENDVPLIMLSKQKLNPLHSVHHYEDSLSGDNSLITPKRATKTKNSHAKPHKHEKKKSIHGQSECSTSPVMIKRDPISQMLYVSNKITKEKYNKSAEKKKTSKKYLRKKQMKIYKMITKYLKMEIKSKKRKNKSKKRKIVQESSKSVQNVNLVSSDNESDSESTLSSDSVALIYDSVEQDHAYSLNKNFIYEKEKAVQCENVCDGESSNFKNLQEHNYSQNKNFFQNKLKKFAKEAGFGESSSTSEKNTKSKKDQKSLDKYRLGFLSNKFSLRFYNRFLASERLLLSKCMLKKNKKKEVKRLFNRLKAVGLMSLK